MEGYGYVRAQAIAGAAAIAQVAALVLAGPNMWTGHLSAGRFGICLIVTVAVALYAGVGRMIASRLPGNAIGWLLCLTGLLSALVLLAEQYALFGVASATGSVPAARIIGWLTGPLSVPVIAMMGLIVLLFPDARLPSGRWRPLIWAIALITTALITTNMQAGGTVAGTFDGALAAAGVSFPSPVAIFPAHGWFGELLKVILIIAFATGVLVVASVFVRRRGASFERRKQLEWLGYVGLLTAVWVAGLEIVTSVAPGSAWPPS
jgi:hypothetical protein